MIPIPYTSTDWPSYTYELVLRFKLLHKKVRTPKKKVNLRLLCLKHYDKNNSCSQT